MFCHKNNLSKDCDCTGCPSCLVNLFVACFLLFSNVPCSSLFLYQQICSNNSGNYKMTLHITVHLIKQQYRGRSCPILVKQYLQFLQFIAIFTYINILTDGVYYFFLCSFLFFKKYCLFIDSITDDILYKSFMLMKCIFNCDHTYSL